MIENLSYIFSYILKRENVYSNYSAYGINNDEDLIPDANS